MTTGQRDLSVRADGLLASFGAAGVLTATDVQVATTLLRLARRAVVPEAAGNDADELVSLAAALTVRALRHGSVALDLTAVRADVRADEDVDPAACDELPWPDPAGWAEVCRTHHLVADGPDAPADRPLRWDGDLLYLQKYWQQEAFVADQIARRATAVPPSVDTDVATAALAELFPHRLAESQRHAAEVAVTSRFMILSGGPGTGKTTTIARLLVLLHTLHGRGLRVALAAPTGKAAARITEAVADDLADLFAGSPGYRRVEPFPAPEATTIHRLLGWRPDSQHRFRHDRHNPLPHDVVVVDEVSMVSLTTMARLLEAVRPQARLVLVGDPDQLASIEAGAILADLVSVPETGSVTLQHNFRSVLPIADLAAAIRDGDADEAVTLLRAGSGELMFCETTPGTLPEHASDLPAIRREIVDRVVAIGAAAAAGRVVDALQELDRHRVLCAHRAGPYGVGHWNAMIDSWVVVEHGLAPEAAGWRIGQSLIVTANDYGLGLFNGDAGVIVATDAGPMAAFARAEGPLLIPPVRLDTALSLDAMTIHRGQGSQFDAVTVILPPPDSPLLTRELLYTAVTRARSRVRLLGSEESVRAAISRRVARAGGLAPALRRRLDR